MQLESLCDFLAGKGGLALRMGEFVTCGAGDLRQLRAQDWHKARPFRRRLVRDDGKGMSPDHACLVAWEAGFFPEHYDRPELPVLFDALDRELRGDPVYRPEDEERLAIMAEAEMVRERSHDDAPQDQPPVIATPMPHAPILEPGRAVEIDSADQALELLRSVPEGAERRENLMGDVAYCYRTDYRNKRGVPGTVWYAKVFRRFETSALWHKVFRTAAERDAAVSAWLIREETNGN